MNNTPHASATLAELRRHVDAVSRQYAWRDAWNRRLGTPDGWRSPIRVALAHLDDFEAGLCDPDPATLDTHIRRLLAGELFGAATPIDPTAVADALRRLTAHDDD